MNEPYRMISRNAAPAPLAVEGGRSPTGAAEGAGAGEQVPQRWRAHRKAQVVLRLLRGEPVDLLSRELGLPVSRLEQWRDEGLAGMEAALVGRSPEDPAQRKLDEANRRIGELSMEVELLRSRIDKAGPFPGRRSIR